MFANVTRSRLLPMSLPFRYFGAAVAFQAAAWALLLAHARELNAFAGGLGPVFAALHLVTLGVLVTAAIGATLQLLPVATRQPVRALWAVKLAWWALVPGVALFAAGALAYRLQIMGPGAVAVALALAVYAVLLFGNLRGARGMRVVVAHGWAALACLVAFAATGLALAARYEHGLALDHAAFRDAHVVLAAYGFMGLLALGLSNFLLPMLAVAPPPPARVAYVVLGAAVAGIAAAAAGWLLPAALLGLGAAALHVSALERAPLGPGFALVRVSWACLFGSLALAGLIALDLAPARAALLFGVLLVPGWLLSFLLGVMQRIVPFLASVHALSGGRPLASKLTPHRLLVAHRALHLAALALLLAGIAAGADVLVLAGAAAGLGAALAYAAFFVYVLLKAHHHDIRPRHQPAAA